MRSLLLLCLALLLAVPAGAQGFNSTNGRNHPELDWQVAETEHFRIMYPARLAGIENEAAPIAEASYEALSANLGVTFEGKIRIYLSDEDEVINGFAVPIGDGYTDIWVHVNDLAGNWTGREKWLRKVVAHELAHIFHFKAVSAPSRLLNFILGDPLPRFWTEGLAQYETEVWDAQRGDRWLRTAVLDDRLSYNDGRSLWNGRLMYAVGNSQVRYFAEQYGDSTLANLLAHRKKVLFGLAQVHDFGDAMQATIDKSYPAFYDDWRRHVNVYYNILAGQMNGPDSLGTAPLRLPGQYYYDVRYSPDTAYVAVVSHTSLQRPVRRLYVVDREKKTAEVVAEGAIQAPVAWSPDGRRLAFARTERGRYGALLNDLFLVDADGRNLRRLTHSRRAGAPAFSPDGRRLAFVGTEAGTSNVFVLDLATGSETQLTRFTGDVQLSWVRWHPSAGRLAFSRFAADGTRDVVLLDVETGALTPITGGAYDDRGPVWSPDGRSVAYTSLRDDVPNVFVYDVASRRHRRATYQVTGATVHDWLPPDSARAEGTLALLVFKSKTGDQAYRVDAARTVAGGKPDVPAPYAAWTRHRPPAEVPPTVPARTGSVTARYEYSSWRNVTHAGSAALPYINSADDWGVAGFTSWVEPLGKHLFVAGGALSFPDLQNRSVGLLSYVNNQWYPTLSLNLYRLPGSARAYDGDVLVEDYTGGDVSAFLPVDWRARPYVYTAFGARLRYVDFAPLNLDDFDPDGVLPFPAGGQQADLQLTLLRRKQRPYALNVVHPLDGWGVRAQLLGAARVLGGDTRFVRGDLSAYRILPAPGATRLFAYGRARAQAGDPFPQNYLGLARPDDIQIVLPGQVPLSLGDTERVRGYRSYALGDRMLFGTLEYRVPLAPSLQTRVLGLVSLGATTLAFFTDAGLVWEHGAFDEAVDRVGVGAELKNAITLGGLVSFAHSLGIAQPAHRLGTDDGYEVYYRIRATVPF